MDLNFITNFFMEKLNVTLEDEWLEEVVIFLRSLDYDGDSLLAAVYEQWLYTDLKISTKPLLSLPVDKRSKQAVIGGITVIQINSIIDIGTSIYSQYRKLTHKFEDNSGFQLKSEENEINSDSFMQKPKRMLSMEVTDGQFSMKAIEYRPINTLSLLTCPGCKIRLTNKVYCRRGILLLTESNCMILGGDDDLLMKTGRPVEVMMKHLNIGVALEKKNSVGTMRIKREGNRCLNTSTTQQDHQAPRNHIPKASGPILSHPQSSTKPVMQVKPLSEEESLSRTLKRKIVAANEAARMKESVNAIKQQVKALQNEGLGSSRSKTQIALSTSKCPENSSSHNTATKRIKMELPDNDDDNDIIIVEQPESVKQEIKEENISTSKCMPATPQPSEEPIISAFKRLGIESIAKALWSMRFALGPRRKTLAAIMETKPLEPLHINDDGLWALTVALSDESYECLTCNVSNEFLVELIGWTAAEALAARASKDSARRKEGTLRTRTAGQSMRRLDLIWEVEFFPLGASTPIIHRIDTYAQKLGLI